MSKTSDPKQRPPGGEQFEAVHIGVGAWLVLAPWVQNESGYWWRPSMIPVAEYGGTEEWARHYADAINAAMRCGKCKDKDLHVRETP